MFSKSTIALSAMLIVSATSAAFAYDEPENRLGDRYPSLERIDRSVSNNNGGMRHVMVRQAAQLVQYTNEDPENRIGDRYSSLEQIVPVTNAKAIATRAAKPFTVAEKMFFDFQTRLFKVL